MRTPLMPEPSRSQPTKAICSKSPLLFLFVYSACFLIPVDVQAMEMPYSVYLGQMDGKSLWGMLEQGGWAMVPLAFCSLALLFLIIYGWRETSRGKFLPDSIIEELCGLLHLRNLSEAGKILRQNPSVLSRSLQMALERAHPDMKHANKEKVEAAFVENMESEENNIGQWINYLNVVAAVSPMIGLLGTVSGMIGAFSTISSGGMGRPEMLAGDIGEALITTATGLVIGIPAMIAYFILKNRLGNQLLATTQTANRLIEHLSGEISPEKPFLDRPS